MGIVMGCSGAMGAGAGVAIGGVSGAGGGVAGVDGGITGAGAGGGVIGGGVAGAGQGFVWAGAGCAGVVIGGLVGACSWLLSISFIFCIIAARAAACAAVSSARTKRALEQSRVTVTKAGRNLEVCIK